MHQHCKQLLLNLLVVLGKHGDHLSVASVLLNNKTTQVGFAIIIEKNIYFIALRQKNYHGVKLFHI